ncbi:hypothetical protein O181_065697 [Austropuccinia psidii MF-1]|uniref:Uncharacterized protein n=1 Tax=Austropuccinia psidii MF-1 TaxID=1389203 RepID=A0A9Q3ETZ4_9BASI|nr:hypothetical protein [Austropuccinia psidii MF-1]
MQDTQEIQGAYQGKPTDRLGEKVCQHVVGGSVYKLNGGVGDSLFGKVKLNVNMLHLPIVDVAIDIGRINTCMIVLVDKNQRVRFVDEALLAPLS